MIFSSLIVFFASLIQPVAPVTQAELDALVAQCGAPITTSESAESCYCTWYRRMGGLELYYAQLMNENCNCTTAAAKKNCLACLESWYNSERANYLQLYRDCMNNQTLSEPTFSWGGWPSGCDPIVVFPDNSPDCPCVDTP